MPPLRPAARPAATIAARSAATIAARSAAVLATAAMTPLSVGQLTFVDVAPDVGIQNVSLGRGSAMVDIDGDGRLDIVAANTNAPNGFFQQRPNERFEDASAAWRIEFDDRATWGTLVADFDNDGDPDIYFINGGFIAPQANQLLRNDLSTLGLLSDVSVGSGAAGMVSMNFGGTAIDYDRDGDLDIFLTTTGLSPIQEPCILLRNDGNLSFTDVSKDAGIYHKGSYRHCSSGDFDNDGWIDIAVANRAECRLYRNNGDGTFNDVAAAAGVTTPGANFGLQLEDFDNDGWLDIYAPKWLTGFPATTSRLFRNNRDGTFIDVTAGSGMTGQSDMGHNTGDLDGDGYPDIFIGTGEPPQRHPDVLFLVTPDESGGFVATDVSESSGILVNGPTRCHGLAFGDYNEDGAVDVYACNGGILDKKGQEQEDFLWQNQDTSNAWTALRLTGVVSNRSAVGAHCVAYTDAGRQVHRYRRVGNGFANSDSPIQHFGIGQDNKVVRIEILWPSGIRQTVYDPPMSTVTDVVEPDSICPGDVDGDRDVDFGDVLNLLLNWGPCPGCAGDIDGSRTIDFGDIVIQLGNWGPCQ